MKKVFLLFCLSLLLTGTAFCAPDIAVTGRMIRIENLAPGAGKKDTIVIKNRSQEPAEVKVYLKDYLMYADGRTAFHEPGTDKRSNAGWITLPSNRITIPPKSKYNLEYTIQAPKDADLTGSYWSILLLEPVLSNSPEKVKLEKNKIKAGFTTLYRYGVKLVSDIGDTGLRKLKFEKVKIRRWKTGRQELLIDLANSGERQVLVKLKVEMYREGKLFKMMSDPGIRLFPGCSWRYSYLLKKFPAGAYRVIAVADCGDDGAFGAQYKLNLQPGK